jgi:small subunit ribosomal protein S20
MPITKSAKKALRQSRRRRAKNIQKKRKLKDLLKEVKNLISQKKTEEVKKLLPQVYKVLDKAAKTGLIKPRTASRKKSRLTQTIRRLGDFSQE